MFTDTGTIAYFRFGTIHYHFYYGQAEEVLWIYHLIFNPSIWLQSLAGCGRDDDILIHFWPFFFSISTVVTALVSSWLMVPRVLATERSFFPAGSCCHLFFSRNGDEFTLSGHSEADLKLNSIVLINTTFLGSPPKSVHQLWFSTPEKLPPWN